VCVVRNVGGKAVHFVPFRIIAGHHRVALLGSQEEEACLLISACPNPRLHPFPHPTHSTGSSQEAACGDSGVCLPASASRLAQARIIMLMHSRRLPYLYPLNTAARTMGKKSDVVLPAREHTAREERKDVVAWVKGREARYVLGIHCMR